MTGSVDELLDLAGRIMLTHQIASEHLQQVLGGDRAAARAVIDEGRSNHWLDPAGAERLALFVNLLLRLEWRLHGNSRAIRLALTAPLDALDGVAPADLLGGTSDELRSLRYVIETIEAPRERWFRVGH